MSDKLEGIPEEEISRRQAELIVSANELAGIFEKRVKNHFNLKEVNVGMTIPQIEVIRLAYMQALANILATIEMYGGGAGMAEHSAAQLVAMTRDFIKQEADGETEE
jgi:hypothetical protein